MSLYLLARRVMRLPLPAKKTASQRKAKTVTQRDLSGWKHLRHFVELLEKHLLESPVSASEKHGLRELDRRGYLSLFLLGVFNPVVESMCGLCRASALPKVRELAGIAGPVANQFVLRCTKCLFLRDSPTRHSHPAGAKCRGGRRVMKGGIPSEKGSCQVMVSEYISRMPI